MYLYWETAMNHKRQTENKPKLKEKRAITIICGVLSMVIIGLGCYAAGWYANRARIEGASERYRAMYRSQPLENSTSFTRLPSTTLLSKSKAPAVTPTMMATLAVTHTPTAIPTVEPLETVSPEPTPIANPIAQDEPIATANAETLVIALPTAPPKQDSFEELLAHNPETVGYLDIPDLISLPVVQRENDNDYYLTHNFDGDTALEGALFMDGVNRLIPEDDCLIVYGHNMKNGTMFGNLSQYASKTFAMSHPVVRFDTLYENRLYVPFAAFTASMTPGDHHFFGVRQFVLDDTEFELFTLKMIARSAWIAPIDVLPGDRLLLLVTCNSANREGRFVLALRQLRKNETEDSIRAAFQSIA